MADHESSQAKWEGKVCSKVKGATADQVWPLLEDYFNVHKWLPGIDTCHRVEGTSGQPGCIRYCANTNSSSSESDDGRSSSSKDSIKWANEKLLTIDPAQKCFSYEVTENNIGFNSYVATFRLSPADDGCKIEWSFVVDPIQGWKLEDLVSCIDYNAQYMAKTMEEALQSVL